MTNFYRQYYSIDYHDSTEELEQQQRANLMNDNHAKLLSLLTTFKKPTTKITTDSITIEYFNNSCIITFIITHDNTYRWEIISYITDSTFRGTNTYSSIEPSVESALYQYFLHP